MEEEWQPDAIVRVKLEALRKDFFDYIEKNIDKIDDNVPVFYGHVIATLERTFPEINDDLHDRFIDSITAKVLHSSKRSGDLTFVGKLFDYAVRNKKKKAGKALYDIMLGMKMINSGKYAEAIEHLKNYRNVDAIICPAIAYCHFVLSTNQPGSALADDGRGARPSRTALAAREQMIELIRLKPPVNRLTELEITEDPEITKIFWFMIKQAFEWFPSEREFFRIGLEKATKDGRREIREEILAIAIERFYNDMYFLRELYKHKLESRDAGGVAGVVKQMTQQYPDDLEPIYYGLKLSIMTTRLETYYRFRKLAVLKNIPPNALLVLDFAFELMSGKQYEALACLDEIKMKFGARHYYATLLEYVAHDFLSDDEKKVKQAKKAMIDSIDQYCLRLLKIPSG
jgi:hypothetical protein